MTGRRHEQPAPVVVVERSSLPRGEELSSGAGAGETGWVPDAGERWSRRLAAVALLVLVGGLVQASDLRRDQAAQRALGDVLAVSAVVGATADPGGGVELSLVLRNAGPRPVVLQDARVTPVLPGSVPVVVERRLRPAGSARVDLRVEPDCRRLGGLAAPRRLAITAVAGSGRRQDVGADVSEDLDRLARVACRRLPVAASLVVSASRAVLRDRQLRFTLTFARDTLLSGTLIGVEAQGLRVLTPQLPRPVPLQGRGRPGRVDVVVEVADCRRLVLNPRGYLLTLGFVVADSAGRRSVAYAGLGGGEAPLNRLGAGLLAAGCGFDPLFRVA